MGRRDETSHFNGETMTVSVLDCTRQNSPTPLLVILGR